MVSLVSILFSSSFLWAKATIPMEISRTLFSGGDLSVHCQVGDYQGSCKVDSGINISLIPVTQETLQYKSLAQVKHTGVSGGQMICDWVRVPNWSLSSDLAIENVEVVRCPVPEGSKPLVGLDILRQFQVHLSYRTQNLILQKLTSDIFKNKFAVSDVGHALLPVTWGIQTTVDTVAMFDTGAGITVVSRDFYNQHPELFTVVQSTEVSDTKGHIIKTDLAIATKLMVGDHRFVAEYVYIMDFSGFQELLGKHVTMILGHNMIVQADWAFNFANQTWE